MKAEEFDRYTYSSDGIGVSRSADLYSSSQDICAEYAAMAMLNRRAQAVLDNMESPDSLIELSRIPIPVTSGPRFYGINRTLFNRAFLPPTPREVWYAHRHRERKKRWLEELQLFYGEEGAKRIAYWLR